MLSLLCWWLIIISSVISSVTDFIETRRESLALLTERPPKDSLIDSLTADSFSLDNFSKESAYSSSIDSWISSDISVSLAFLFNYSLRPNKFFRRFSAGPALAFAGFAAMILILGGISGLIPFFKKADIMVLVSLVFKKLSLRGYRVEGSFKVWR